MRLGFSPSTGTAHPFIASAFSPSTYARTKAPRHWDGIGALGLDVTSNTIASEAMSGAAMTGTILTSLAHMGMISAAFGPAAPIAAIVVGLAAIGIGIANLFKGCGQTCVEATNIANQLQTYWQNNLNQYMASPIHYKSLQLAALNNFDTGWNALVKACGDPSLGVAGQKCISERQRGGASAWCCNAPNAVDVGNGMCTGCDAFADLRDPIANDPTVVPDPTDASQFGVVGATGAVGSASSGSGFPIPLLLIGGGVLAFSMMGDN